MVNTHKNIEIISALFYQIEHKSVVELIKTACV